MPKKAHTEEQIVAALQRQRRSSSSRTGVVRLADSKECDDGWVDQFTRECVLLAADRSTSGAKVAEALQRVIEGEGAAPDSITCDNGSEFAGRVLEAWALEHGVQLILKPSAYQTRSATKNFGKSMRVN